MCIFSAGSKPTSTTAPEQLPPLQTSTTSDLKLPKNKSTSNLLSHSSPANSSLAVNTVRPRMSFDAGTSRDYDRLTRSPIVPEHEHGLGASGLRRIRQQPLRPSTSGATSRSASINLSLPPTRHPSASHVLPSGPGTPALNFSEDLSRFPSESLHSFSFAHQSEDFIYNRQNVLKRSIDFMRDKLGWAAINPGIASAQARLSGDQELQSMMDLLARANLIGEEALQAHGLGGKGPVTGPADPSGENIFDKSFAPRSESPEPLDENTPLTSPRSASAFSPALKPTMEEALAPESESSVLSSSQTSGSPGASPHKQLSRLALKRTYTDTAPLKIQSRLNDALAQPYLAAEPTTFAGIQAFSPKQSIPQTPLPSVPGSHSSANAPHGHGSRWAPAAQAIFTTEAQAPWTITAANDLACLVFGVTRSEVRKMGILEVVQQERRQWLENKLRDPEAGSRKALEVQAAQKPVPTSNNLSIGNGITAKLLSKPSSRVSQKKRAKTDDGSGSSSAPGKNVKGGLNHQGNKSRGVLLCGDVVPIQKRNGATGAASLWVKEKRGGLIWVLEEIAEDVVFVTVDEIGSVIKGQGAIEAIWGTERVRRGMDLARLIPEIPRVPGTNTGALDFDQISELKTFTARTQNSINIPITVYQLPEESTFRVSSFPHIAGILVLNASTLQVSSANTVFSSSLFGQANPDGLHVTELLPSFDKILHIMTDEDEVSLVDGIVIPEHSFRRARALLAMREGREDAAAVFLRPSGLPAKHRDGAEIMVDVQMRVVKSDKSPKFSDSVIVENESEEDLEHHPASEVVYALWITYSRQLHAVNHGVGPVTPLMSRPGTPPHQPSPGQSVSQLHPEEADASTPRRESPPVSLLSRQIKEVEPPSTPKRESNSNPKIVHQPATPGTPAKKKTIDDFVVLEDMGQGAYGQVKLCRYKNGSKKMVIKYVTKRRILVDTWTRDRRLGTVPLEIHVLDYIRRDGFKHPNIVEMADFFEDDVNYYIEMVPHGLPGMDLFDYIELRVNMDETECRKIFVQVAEALHHLHTKAKVVHRDIKDENVILDGEGNIKLIDFGSAAYIKNGPFDVFVGTIDYAAPEVLAGKSYRGKEQDVWALGILLYTIVYKENPFYSIDEIMDHDLRVPYIMSEESIDLIRLMLNRDVDQRITIGQVLEHPWCKMEGQGTG
ncbi:serine threonine protein [Diplodia corticola]|uniref:non-specific serine/threonine protein kinase n=1 Tax=Diplodia corticola TaxID=236234 RepID=A0A1J9S9W2_9PEZI|nr:serine threonine protein [Diplodia corticola]OJD36373.1 serine threonine protein [Diplodia corticola]